MAPGSDRNLGLSLNNKERLGGFSAGPWPVQLRYETGLTGEEYVRAEAWRDARLERCPNHPHGGCSLAGHGTYARKTPRGAKIARWYCPESHTTISLLPDCLAARLPGTLDTVEAVVAHAERSRSLTETAKALRHDAIELPGAIRWVRRRIRLVRRLLDSVAELLPERFALGIAGLIPLRAHLDTGRALVELRRLLAPLLYVLPMPLGFSRERSRAPKIRPGLQHTLGHDPPPSAA